MRTPGGTFIDVVAGESSVAPVMTRRIIQKDEMADVNHPGEVDDGNGRILLKIIDRNSLQRNCVRWRGNATPNVEGRTHQKEFIDAVNVTILSEGIQVP